MSYPRFTKIIIDYFMSRDQSISRRNKMFWHTARDGTMFTSIRCISRHEDTQVYGAILPKYLTNQAMLESKAYKTYYAFDSGEKIPKLKIKTKVKVAKSDKKKQPVKMPKAKGLDVLSKVALTKAEQLNLATKRSKTQFHSSHASGSGYRVDTQSKVPDEQHLKTTGADGGTGAIPGVPDVPIYESESEKESWGDSGEEDEDDENDFEDKSDETDSDRTESDRIKIPVLNQSSTKFYKEEEEKINDEEMIDEEEDDEVTKELFDQVEEDAHATLTPVLDTQKADEPVQSSFVSSDFTSKLLNLENPSSADNGIASLLYTTTHHATTVPKVTSSFTTTIPPPPMFFNPLLQQATPTPTPITSEAKTSFPSLMDLSYIFRFNDRVTNLEKDLSELKQVDQYAQAISLIPSIADRYMDNKLGEAIHKAIQLHNAECREEAQAKKQEYIDNVDSTVRTITIEEVKAQLSKILPKAILAFATSVIERNVTKSLEVVVLARWYSPSVTKTKTATYEIKWIEELVHNLWSPVRKRIIAVTRLMIMKKYDYGHLEEIEVRREDQKLYKFREGDFPRLRLQDIEHMLLLLVQHKLTNLTIDEGYALNVALHMFTRWIVIQRRVQDLQLGVKSYQKKLNLTKPDTFRSNLRNKTTYTAYSDHKGVIYKDQMNKSRLMRADELHKFSDGTLDDVRSALNDIAKGIRMECMPKRKWSNLDI
nr:hypothetical protein [Tanacetum cinerariifolium]